MKIILVGGGGREDTILKAVIKNPDIEKIYSIPGNAGSANFNRVERVNISAEDINKITDFAVENNIDFAIVAPDDPLALGLVDMLEAKNIKCFGPNKLAAEVESSKIFAKSLMKKYNIPTADYEIFNDVDSALSYVAKSDYPLVIKADGLAKGKGVVVAESFKQAREAVLNCLKSKIFGQSGEKIVIEKFLTGHEATVMAFTDGKVIIPMISSMDHKRALDGNKGSNTGGMGVIAPNPFYNSELENFCMNKIFLPTLNALNSEGRKFKGCLYFGLMLHDDNTASVIEYNSRFGDPEAEAVLPLLKTDLFEIMRAVSEERLSDIKIEFEQKYSCCVILASGGYPGRYLTGNEITFDDEALSKIPNVQIFHAGTKFADGKFLTNGGRVLAVNAVADEPETARLNAYEAVNNIKFDNMFYRHDIGTSHLKK